MPVLKLGRKPIAGLADDGVNFKLGFKSGAHAKALAMAGAHLFQPSMHGKSGPVMKQWVVIPVQRTDSYLQLAQESIKFVEQELGK